MRPSVLIKVIFLLLSLYDLRAQNKYWIAHSDGRADTLIDSLGLTAVACSDWLQSCSYDLRQHQFEVFERGKITLTPVRTLAPSSHSAEKQKLTFALDQIEAQAFIERGLDGTGVKIGIIDGGFLKANEDKSLSHFFNNRQVVFYKDYITPDLKPYGGAHGLDDGHGTEVWQLIGGVHPTKNVRYGLASGSTYYLARTDHGGFERKIEEDYLIQAMEDMAEMGVRLFNISLGYTNEFEDESENHAIADVDGKTSMLTKAMDQAAHEQGLLFVVAAGNDGHTSWKTLSIPADAHGVLTVGASKYKVWDKMYYSSIGPEGLPFIKPNISVYSTLGTSYSTPIITGVAASMWQLDSTLTNFEIMEILEKASHFYPYGNNYLGYGVPTCPNILKIMDGNEKDISRPEVMTASRSSLKLKADFRGKTVVVYHKKDSIEVAYRLNLKPDKNKLKLTRPENVCQSSVLIDKRVIEIFWED